MSIQKTIAETVDAARYSQKMIDVLIAESLCGTAAKNGNCDCAAHAVARAIRGSVLFVQDDPNVVSFNKNATQ